MPDLQLAGCRPEPLAHYLKALGIFRLVSEQIDPEARGWWQDDVFWLRTKLSRNDLEQFFLETYQPTPIVAPWNGGSGFYPNDRKDAIDTICSSDTNRLAKYRETIKQSKEILQTLELQEKPSQQDKQTLLQACRSRLPNESLAWLDAVFILTEKDAKYPPLLGTGGNDGRLDFTNNFMQRLTELFDFSTKQPKAFCEAVLHIAVWDEVGVGLSRDKPIGQFSPGSAGGANTSVGFSAKSLINPWDFVLMIEGALLFSASTTKRLASEGKMEVSYPFTTRATGVGYASASGADETPRGEMWMPLWSSPACLSEISALFSEGRAQIGRRPAKTGVDFTRALATLGTDRGVHFFQRYGFQERNGLAYFATPLGRWHVVPRPEVHLLNDIDYWLSRFRQAATKSKAPARMGQILRVIERAIMEFCHVGDAPRLANVLISLGQAETTLAKSPKFRKDNFIKPIPLLAPNWLDVADDGSVEYRLAASLASIGIRENMEPVKVTGNKVGWLDVATHPRVVWGHGSLNDNMLAVFSRRCMDAQRDKQKGLPLWGKYPATLKDILKFIEGNVDEIRLNQLLGGLTLLNWNKTQWQSYPSEKDENSLPALYALLKLTHLPGPFVGDIRIPYVAAILAHAGVGNAAEASRQAVQRLRGSGFIPLIKVLHEPKPITRRIAAAVLFPVSKRDVSHLACDVLMPLIQNVKSKSLNTA